MPEADEGVRWSCGCLVIDNRVVESCDQYVHAKGSRWSRFARGEKVYMTVGDGVHAPEGRVWHDDGGEYVKVVGMQLVLGVSRPAEPMGVWWAGSMMKGVEVPADRLRPCRRDKHFLPLTERPTRESDSATPSA